MSGPVEPVQQDLDGDSHTGRAGVDQGVPVSRRGRIPAPLRHTLGVLVVVLLVYYLGLPEIAGPIKSLSILQGTDVPYVVLGAALEIASICAYALLTKVLIGKTGPDLWTVARIDLSTMAVSHVMPAGAISGTGLGYRLLTTAGLESRRTALLLATQAGGSASVLNVILWMALAISVPLSGFNPIYRTVALLGVVLIGGIGILVVLMARGQARAEHILLAVANKMPFLHERMVKGLIGDIANTLADLAGDRVRLAKAVGLAAANWLLDAASLWVMLYAFGHRLVSPIALVVSYGVANVLAALPFTPGGLGIVETVLPSLLVGFGSTRGIAVLGVIAWRLMNFWLPIPTGALAYLSLKVEPGSSAQRKLEALAELAAHADADEINPPELDHLGARPLPHRGHGSFRPAPPHDPNRAGGHGPGR